MFFLFCCCGLEIFLKIEWGRKEKHVKEKSKTHSVIWLYTQHNKYMWYAYILYI
jgi:hypothetical protein